MPVPRSPTPFSITVTFSEPVTGFEPRRRERQRVGAAAASGPVAVDIAAGGAGRRRQPERGGGAVLDRRGPDTGAGSAGDRRGFEAERHRLPAPASRSPGADAPEDGGSECLMGRIPRSRPSTLGLTPTRQRRRPPVGTDG